MTKSLIALHQLAGETLIVPYAWEPFGPYARNWLLAEKSRAVKDDRPALHFCAQIAARALTTA